MMSEADVVKGLTEELLSVNHFTREDVYTTFEAFVKNKELLRRCVDIGDLHFDYIKYQTMFKNTLFEEGISSIIELTHHAYQVSDKTTTDVLTEGYRRFVQGLAHYTQTLWSNSPSIDRTRPDVFVKAAFSRIGDAIENSLKPYLLTTNEMRCIIENSVPKQKTLGAVVDALIQYDPIFKALYSDLLLGITVSQWRNIANHGDYRYAQDGIHIEYGPESERKRKTISQDELTLVLIAIDNLLYMNKTARTLVSIDYYGRYSAEPGRSEKSTFARKDDQIMQIVETSYAYGFTVSNLELSDTLCQLEINQSFGRVNKAELQTYLSLLSAMLDRPFSCLIYRKNKVEYTADFKNRQLIVMRYIVK